jgi:hypothetical protein
MESVLHVRYLSRELKTKGSFRLHLLPVVLYGYETWSLTLREEHRLSVVVNGALKRVFGPKRDETTGGNIKWHKKELRDVNSSASIMRNIKSRMRWAGHVARIGEKKTAYM